MALVFACLVVIPSGTLVRGQVRDVTLCMNLSRSISILQLKSKQKKKPKPMDVFNKLPEKVRRWD